MKYKNWLKKWIEEIIKPISTFNTYYLYENTINLHINPFLGEKIIKKINSYDVQQLVNVLSKQGNLKTKEGLSNNYVNQIISLIKNSIRSYNLSTSNNSTKIIKVVKPKIDEDHVCAFSIQEQERFVKYIMQNHLRRYYGYLICLFTGLRLGELLSLKWDDIDFNKLELRVNKTLTKSKNIFNKITWIESKPKTTKSNRIIPIIPKLNDILYELKENSEGEYVISFNGHHKCPRSYQTSFKVLTNKLGIYNKTIHSLRHTFATRLIEKNVNPKVISELMGHTNCNITLNRYCQCFIEEKRKEIEKISQFLTF